VVVPFGVHSIGLSSYCCVAFSAWLRKWRLKDIAECLCAQDEDGFELAQIVGNLYYFKRQKRG